LVKWLSDNRKKLYKEGLATIKVSNHFLFNLKLYLFVICNL